MKPHIHAVNSVRKHGGKPEDYQDIHDLLDMPKAAHPDMRHRAILHNAMGCFIAEKAFGITRVNSDGRTYSVRDIAEEHIIEDMGRIPTLSDYLDEMPMYEWLGGPKRKITMIPFNKD